MSVKDVPESLLAALKAVNQQVDRRSAVGEFARLLQPLLDRAVEVLSDRGVSRPARRGTGVVEYVVERTQQGEVLTEHRPGRGSKPFRCPKAVYEASVEVFDGADRPLSTEELAAALERKLTVRPPDHQVRVPLRLWLHVEPSIVARTRAKYWPVSKVEFRVAAKSLWKSLNE